VALMPDSIVMRTLARFAPGMRSILNGCVDLPAGDAKSVGESVAESYIELLDTART